jgi:hypothetical protein
METYCEIFCFKFKWFFKMTVPIDDENIMLKKIKKKTTNLSGKNTNGTEINIAAVTGIDSIPIAVHKDKKLLMFLDKSLKNKAINPV